MAKLTPKQYQTKKIAQSQKAHAAATKKREDKANRPGVFRSVPATTKQYSTLTPDQQNLHSIIASLAGKSLPQTNLPGSQQNSFEPQREDALRRFSEEGIPSIAARFQGMTNGALSSEDLYQQLGGARSQLEGQLKSLESQYNLQNSGQQSGNLLSLLNMGLGGNQFDYTRVPEQQSLLKQGINAFGPQLLDKAGGGFMGALKSLFGRGGNSAANENTVPETTGGGQSQNTSGFTSVNNPGYAGNFNSSALNGYQNNLFPQSGSSIPGILGNQDILGSITQGYGQQFNRQF